MKTGRLLTFPFEISLCIVIMSARLISVTSMFWREPFLSSSIIHLIIVCCNYYKYVLFLLFIVLISYRVGFCYSLLLLCCGYKSILRANKNISIKNNALCSYVKLESAFSMGEALLIISSRVTHFPGKGNKNAKEVSKNGGYFQI